MPKALRKFNYGELRMTTKQQVSAWLGMSKPAKPRAKRTNKEFDEQVQVIAWWYGLKNHNQIPACYHLYSNRLTQRLTPQQQGREKRAGMMAGVCDLFLAVPQIWLNDGKPGLYIEMKSPDVKPKTARSKGGLSPEQMQIIADFRQVGYKCVVCYSANDAIKEIESYLRLEK